MDSLSRLSDLFPDVSRQRHTTWRYGLAAVTMLLVMGVVIFWGLPEYSGRHDPVSTRVAAERSQSSPGLFDDIYETSIGEHSSVNLPDGTGVVLNTNSHIRASYTDKERFILLSRGEAHFSVAEDNSRPLTVHAGNRFIRAVGTAFNVEIGRDNIVEIIVTEGKVLIVDQAVSGSTGIPLKQNQDSPGRAGRLRRGGGHPGFHRRENKENCARRSRRRFILA